MRTKMRSYNLENGVLPSESPLVAVQPMADVSHRYGFVSTKELVDQITAKGFVPVSCQIASATDERIGFQKHRIEFELPNSPVALDGTRLRLIMINSHDRTSAVHIYLGWFRMLCENGLICGDTLSEPIKVYHMGGPRLAVALNEALITALERIPRLTQVFNGMNSFKLDNNEQTVFANKVRIALFTEGHGEYENLFQVQRQGDNEPTFWNAYNVVQETITQGLTGKVSTSALTGQRRMIKARPIKAIERNVKVNRLIFDVALTYYKELTE